MKRDVKNFLIAGAIMVGLFLIRHAAGIDKNTILDWIDPATVAFFTLMIAVTRSKGWAIALTILVGIQLIVGACAAPLSAMGWVVRIGIGSLLFTGWKNFITPATSSPATACGKFHVGVCNCPPPRSV